jgi:hypothetical protein
VWEPGTTTKLYCETDDPSGTWPPAVGDLVATPAGAAYRIDEARRSPTKPERVYLQVTRLDRHACAIGDPGVWPLHWHPRSPRR